GLDVKKRMRPHGIARHESRVTRTVDNGDNKAAAKTRQGRLALALVCAQNEFSIRAIRVTAISRLREGLAVEQQAAEKTTKRPPLRPSHAVRRYASRFIERERDHPIIGLRFGRKRVRDRQAGRTPHDMSRPSVRSRMSRSFTSSVARVSSTSNSLTK